MATTINLIDTENVGRKVIPFLLEHAKDEHCVVFYTKNAPTIPMEDMASLVSILHNVEFEKCVCGPNALDMQLVSQLGVYISKDPEAKYVIISNDHDFEPVIEYWKSRNVSIERNGTNQEDSSHTKTIFKTEKNPNFPEKKKPVKNKHSYNGSLSSYRNRVISNGVKSKDVDKILEIVSNHYKVDSKKRLAGVYTKMLNVFGSKIGLAYYRGIKSFINDMFKTIESSEKNISVA